MRRVVLTIAAAVLLTGCGSGDTDAEPSATVTVTETPDQDDDLAATEEELFSGETPSDGDSLTFPTEAVTPGDSFDVVLPPDEISGLPEAFVEVDLNDITYEPGGCADPDQVCVVMDVEVRNVGEQPASLEGLSFEWVGEDGLLQTNIGVFAGDGQPIEEQLGVDQRTVGQTAVDVPREPGTITLYGLDKNITIALDPPSS